MERGKSSLVNLIETMIEELEKFGDQKEKLQKKKQITLQKSLDGSL